MAKEGEEYLTAEELRNRLYHSLRDRGLVNSMKSQLRTSLVSELKHSVKGKLSMADLEVPESGSLLHRASNSLVADHLRSCKYDYTYSVFLPECGIDKAKMLSNQDVLQLLKISPQSRLFRKMTGDERLARKGFLWQLLSELCALHSQSSQSVGTQTDLIKVATVSTLDEKMHVLDELFSSKREEQYRNGSMALEDRLLSFQRQLEERFKTELKLEVSRVKDDEVARIRLEEKENFRRELDKARKDMERTYQSKYDALVQRERNATERLQREQEMQEKEIYNQRQSILEEIEAVRQREAQIKREGEVISREKHLDGERVKALEQDLRRREQEIRKKETEFDQRLNNEMTKFKVEYQAKFLDRSQNIEIREATLREPSQKTYRAVDKHFVKHPVSNEFIDGVKPKQISVRSHDDSFYSKDNFLMRENEKHVAEDQGKIDGLKGELRDKSARVNELETLLQEVRHKEVNATRHNEFLNAKLRDMSDYASIKEQNITYRNELENLKTRMAEIMQLNERERIRQEEMLRELRRPTAIPDYIEKDEGRQSRAFYEHGHIEGNRRYHEQSSKNSMLVRQLEEQTLQMREMNQELVDVKQTLSHTQKALSNEVYRKPQDGEMSRLVSFNLSHRSAARTGGLSEGDSDLDFSQGRSRKGRRSRTTPKVKGYDRDDVYNDISVEDSSATKVSTGFTTDEENSNQSAEIIAETKYRLKSLEKEAQNLEKAYMDFHYQITNPSSIPDPYRHSPSRVRTSLTEKSASKRVPSPTASPIQSQRPMSSTPYQHAQSGAEADVSTDSLQELKGSSSHSKRMSGTRQDAVPKFSLSDVSDDEQHGNGQERIERPRPITVDDLEARPGSPSIMVVQGDGSGSANSLKEKVKEIETVPVRQEPVPVRQEPVLPEVRPPAKLPPLSLDTAWQTPALDTAWKSDKKEEVTVEAGKSWEEEQREKERERKRREQEAWEREQRELEMLQGKSSKLMSSPEREKSPEPETAVEKQPKDDIDPVMQQYMAMVQQQKNKPQEKEPEKPPSQVDEDISLTEEVKRKFELTKVCLFLKAEMLYNLLSDFGNNSPDDFDW